MATNTTAFLIKSKAGLAKIMHATLEYEGTILSYSILTNKRLKHLSIHIHPEKGVIVKNPGFSHEKVNALVREKAKWIASKLLLMNNRTWLKPLFEEEGKVLYLGEEILLHVNQTPENFYKEKTPLHVNELVQKWAFIMGVSVESISFRKTKRRWGSCSHKAELCFALSLAQLPLEAMEYIVIHELSHIKHPHHQSSFWHCVAEFIPSYRIQENTLKSYSPALS